MQLLPYIVFNGQCEEALNFYVNAFGGEIRELMRFEGSPVENLGSDKQQIMHATFIAKDLIIMAADAGEGGPQSSNSGMVHLSVNFQDAAEQEKVFNALSEGATITMPLQDTFWGARFGMLTDKFGVNWMFNYDLPQS